MEQNENEKLPGSESITGYKAWLFFDAALYFVVNTADTASVHLAEKCPLPKKTLECPELEQFVRVYRIEL